MNVNDYGLHLKSSEQTQSPVTREWTYTVTN